jgi:hypothetical protein
MFRVVSMVQRRVVASTIALLVSVLCTSELAAEIGPCTPAHFDFICGSGAGAARAIAKTISPSRRLAFAWRIANKSPMNRPDDNDPNLENLVIRLEDGAVLAKSHGAYWDLGAKIAKAYLMTAWSPDSGLLAKVEQRADLASAELFAFAESDVATGPFDLTKVIEPAVQAKIGGTKSNSSLVFTARPPITIDDQGLIHAVVHTRAEDASDGPTFEVTLKVTRTGDSVDANVVSVTPYASRSISIIVH